METPEEVIEKLKTSKKVTYLSWLQNRSAVILHTRDAALVEALTKLGGTARWYDRTEFSTKSGKSKADFQAEVLLGPRFLHPEVTA